MCRKAIQPGTDFSHKKVRGPIPAGFHFLLCHRGRFRDHGGVPVVGGPSQHRSPSSKETLMLTHLVTRGLAPWRRARRDRANQRPACRLRVEALESRLLLSGDMVLRWNQVLWQAEWTASVFAPVNSRIMA